MYTCLYISSDGTRKTEPTASPRDPAKTSIEKTAEGLFGLMNDSITGTSRPVRVSDRVSERVSDRVSDRISDRVSDSVSVRVRVRVNVKIKVTGERADLQ